MSKVQRLLFAAFSGLSMAGFFAVDEPEINSQGYTNPWELVAIAAITAVATLRILKKLRV